MERFLCIALIALGATAPALAQTVPNPPTMPRDAMPPMETVSVSGTGKLMLTPDRFTFSVGVQTVAPTVEEAVNQNNTRVARVIAALKQAGATDRDIRTSQFSIWPQQDHTQGQLPRILGYQVSNNITVTKDKVGEAGRLLQAALNAGVNHSSGLQFEVSDPARGRDEGMRAAFADARAKAALLAQAAGRTLGRALSISEGAQVNPPPYPMPRVAAMRMEAAQAVSDVPVESGTQEATFTVSVVFELR